VALFGKIIYSGVIVLAVPAAFLGLPAGVLIFFASLVYALLTHFQPITGWTLLAVGVITVVSELADNWAQAAVSWRKGATPRAIGMAFLGSIVGAIILLPVIGLIFSVAGITLGPIVGGIIALVAAMLGAMTGGWIGAFATERSRGKPPREAKRAAWGTVQGRVVGIFIKFGLTLAMIIGLLVKVF
jgi:hypothetical protein